LWQELFAQIRNTWYKVIQSAEDARKRSGSPTQGERTGEKTFCPWGSAQPSEKAQFGQGNQSIFSLISFDFLGLALAGF
jgi:hypothetical protein